MCFKAAETVTLFHPQIKFKTMSARCNMTFLHPSGSKYHSYVLFLFGASPKQGFCNNKFIPIHQDMLEVFMMSRG